MKLTAKDIIKILPFEDTVKQSLLEEFDTLDPDTKLNLVRKVWEGYSILYDLQLKENTQLAMLDVTEGRQTFDKDFQKRIREKTDKEMEKLATEQKETIDLSSARVAMEKIVAEIQASKKKPTKN